MPLEVNLIVSVALFEKTSAENLCLLSKGLDLRSDKFALQLNELLKISSLAQSPHKFVGSGEVLFSIAFYCFADLVASCRRR